MKIRIPLFALCALSVLACDDNAAPDDVDLGPTRDRGVLADPVDSDVVVADTDPVDPDDGVPLLEPEPNPEPDPNPEPEAEPEPEPGGDCAAGETRLCTESCGVSSCVDGVFGPCQPSGELCNGHDDNCDGRQDEGYAGLGVGCVVDQNGCSAQGMRVCAADGASVVCDAPPVVPGPEVCDGDDDDCDGRVDEDFPGRTCCADDLQCGPGETCEAGECTGGVGPGPNPNPAQCVDDFDCFFQVCVQGACRDLCLFDADCAAGEFCDFGACTPGGVQPECIVDADCFGFEECQNGSCVPPQAPACVEDAECPGQQTCQNGVCALPPGLGSCDATVLMNGFGVYRGSNLGGFDSLNTDCGPADDGPEQVFEFTLDVNSRVSIDTNGSAFDTVISVMNGCPGAEQACDDDGGDGLQSAVSFDALAGTTYFVVVNGYDDADTGDIVVNFAGVDICVADDECPGDQTCQGGVCADPPCMANAECPAGQLCEAGDCVPADVPLCADDADCVGLQVCQDRVCTLPPGAGSCDQVVPMDGFGVYRANNVGQPNSLDAGCVGADGPEQVFSFTLDFNARVTLDTNGSAFDTVLGITDDCPGAELFCNDDGGDGNASLVSFEAVAGTTYYAVVHGYDDADVGDIVVNFAGVEICVGDGDCAGDDVCVGGVCVAPLCGDAIEMDGFGDYVGNNVGALDQLDGSCGAADEGAEAIFTFQLDEAIDVTLDTSGVAFDTVLSVWSDCNAADLFCDDDGGDGTASRIEFRAQAGVRYFVVAEGYGGGEGDIPLSFTGDVPPPPPAACDADCQGDCANGICIPAVPAACAGATLAEAVPGAWQGNTAALLDQHDPPCGAFPSPSPDDILVVAFPEATTVTASTEGSDFDTVLYVLEACNAGAVVECNDDTVGLTSEVVFDAEPGVAYYIVVDGYNGSGAFELTVDTQ